jgi:fido (protein-threonine AMPylation protein)
MADDSAEQTTTNITYPEWHIEEIADSSEILRASSAEQVEKIKQASPLQRRSFMLDTRSVHKEIYKNLTPNDFEEYAGTYRGTVGTSLECRSVYSSKPHMPPSGVLMGLKNVEKAVDNLKKVRRDSDPINQFRQAVFIFWSFGLIHPYLNGNGHIQRLLFAAAIENCPNLELLDTWTVDPRPYDRDEMTDAFLSPTPPGAVNALMVLMKQYVNFK